MVTQTSVTKTECGDKITTDQRLFCMRNVRTKPTCVLLTKGWHWTLQTLVAETDVCGELARDPFCSAPWMRQANDEERAKNCTHPNCAPEAPCHSRGLIKGRLRPPELKPFQRYLVNSGLFLGYCIPQKLWIWPRKRWKSTDPWKNVIPLCGTFLLIKALFDKGNLAENK